MLEDIDQPLLADAPDLESFKELRKAQRTAPAEPAEEKTPQPEEGKTAESAAPAVSAEPKVQESGALPSVDKSIDDQIRELRKAGKHAKANELERKAGRDEAKAEREAVEAKNRELEQELSRLRAVPSKSEVPANQPVPQSAGDPEPKVTDAKYQTSDGYQQWIIDKAKWEFRADNRKAEETRVVDTRKQKVKTILEAGKARNPDFEAVLGNAQINTGILGIAIDQISNIGEVMYDIGKNPVEAARIASLSPNDQWFEIRSLSAKLASPAAPAAPPVVLKPAVSRVTPAPRVLTGISEAPPRSLAEATSKEEFSRLRKQQRKAS